ncbi:MAG: choline monooxygenase [Gammaproteobacteria bacterium]|jgi:choline monooxygenase
MTTMYSVESVLQPIESASGLPNHAYTSSEFLEFERENVLGKSWAGLWFASDLPKKGYVKPINFMGLPLVILRNKEDEIKVFHNVCSHRGMLLVHEEMEVQGAIRCKYHSWSYNLNGELKGTPHLGGIGEQKIAGFDHCQHGLKPVRSAVWMDTIFINLSGDAEAFEQYINPLTDQWQAFMGNTGYDRMRTAVNGKGLQIEIKSNWKLAVENYCESYHLPWIHPSLNTYSKLEDHYHIMIEDDFGGQGSHAYRLYDQAGTALPRFPEWPEDKLEQAEYVSFYPNVLLGIQADHCFVMIIEPSAPDRSIEHLRLYYVGDEALDDKHAASRTATLESWRVVFAEDIDAVEGMQKGRQSPGYKGGVFSPVMDNPTHHFHQWVARKIQSAV